MKKIKLKLFHKIFLGLILGTIVGFVLSKLGGEENAFVAQIVPWFGFLGDLFLRLIRMVIVPLVFFSIISGVSNLSDLKKLRSIGIKTIILFLGTAFCAVTIGLIVAQVLKPGTGLTLGEISNSVKVKELPGIRETILNMFPKNPIESMVKGEMLHIISFSIFVGAALLMLGERGKLLIDIVDRASETMFKVTDIVVQITPYGVFGLMAKATTKFGIKIFGPIFKFILSDYLASFIHIALIYTLVLVVFAKVNPIKFYKKAFQPWLVAFSTCSSMATLPVTMRVAKEEIGLPKENASFILPLGATANMNGTSIYFGLIVMFVSQIYNIPLDFKMQAMLVLQATLLSVGCAAVPQVGLLISIALLTSMGLPLDGIALVAGIYRIVDQAHTSTNALGDLVVATAVAGIEGDLDRDTFENGGMFKKDKVAA
ncbi:Na+/H+-dicarboxylate symporter [Caminicella sporogenes DSM 14501]|uniref:Na+/H+-dicarboxylate symporter n=1 Tax=Caminicella sporogenes DSM 14501 TaxID=1121266 RepID=A0A1M6PQ69_9FIRM|nr:dicarboxylate/amino acid:cation symporter [Caminicella sporogenes]RKD22020.1 amino acid:cation symporter [Caminicella sporogenes]WIF96019.1 dicarboxylate/amino acid:cation symporter [Caminicella sporogenes]SHK10076.1 Na+/H+-dicarboxylate symporter [Caminicella sporogenes DSM 14501]